MKISVNSGLIRASEFPLARPILAAAVSPPQLKELLRAIKEATIAEYQVSISKGEMIELIRLSSLKETPREESCGSLILDIIDTVNKIYDC